MGDKFTNTTKDGEVTTYNPDATADFYKIGDHNRDILYMKAKVAEALKLISSTPTLTNIILYGGIVSDGGGATINISAGAAIGKDASGDVHLVEWAAQTGITPPDNAGAQTWAIAEYASKLDASTTRAHRVTAETYHHVLEDTSAGEETNSDWFVIVDPNAVADSKICLGSFTMTAGVYAAVPGERSPGTGFGFDSYDNTYLGVGVLALNTTGTKNTVIGYNALAINTIGSYNIAVGYNALVKNTTGDGNIAIGYRALAENSIGFYNVAVGGNALFNNTTGDSNTAVGYNALNLNTTGIYNTAIGTSALSTNSTGDSNTAVGYNALGTTTIADSTAVGYSALGANTTGTGNTAVGYNALTTNTTGVGNTAVGYNALTLNETGVNNTALGYNALGTNDSGAGNTAVGYNALFDNTTGANNTAVGRNNLPNNTFGDFNTALGSTALVANTTGDGNVAIGYNVLILNTFGNYNVGISTASLGKNVTGNYNIAIGYSALGENTIGDENVAVGHSALGANTTGVNNTAVGYTAGSSITTGSNVTCIGHNAEPTGGATATNEAIIGDSSVTTIGGYAAWTNHSDKRDKNDIQDLDIKGLAFINALKPRKFKWDLREWYAKRDENGKAIRNEATKEWDYEIEPDGSKKKEDFTVGFIAQEIAALQTELNAESLNIVSIPKDLADGNYGIRQSNIIPILVKAVQELSEQVEVLKNK